MIRAFAISTLVAGALGIGWSLSAGVAAAAGADGFAIPPGKPVQSNTSTASSGRRPLAVRIAMADKRKAEVPALPRSTPVAPVEIRPEPAAADVASVESSTKPDSNEADDMATDSPATPAPAATKLTVPRLLVDCEESTIDALPGESIRWRISIGNAGAEAHDVLATLYFAEGIEPMAAKGHGHAVAAGEVRFSPVKILGPDDTVQIEVTGRAVQAGPVAYRIEVGCRDLPGHVAREAVILVRPKPAN